MAWVRLVAMVGCVSAACSVFLSLDDLKPDAAVNNDAACSNTLTDPANCGRCGHSCCGGTCARGECAPANVVNGISEVPTTFAVASTGVFWASNGPGIWFADFDGGTPNKLIYGPDPSHVLALDDVAYFDWPDTGVAAGGLDGGSRFLWQGAPERLLISDATRIFWVLINGTCPQGCVLSALLDGGDLKVTANLPRPMSLIGEGSSGLVVAAGQREVRVFAADAVDASTSLLRADASFGLPVVGDRVYMIDPITSTISAIEWDGGLRDLIQGQALLKALATRGDDLAWISGHDIRACKVHDCAGTVHTLVTESASDPSQVAIGGGCVYWVSPETSSIRRTGL